MSTTSPPLYDTDFYGWIQGQVAALRAGNLAHLDVDNLIEEVESMGRSEQRELESRLELLLIHLLKWRFQPEKRSVSWELTIEEQRKRIAKHLRKNPSLKNHIPEACEDSYDYAVLAAAKETRLHRSVFPKQCPWTFEQMVKADFWPEA